MKSGHSNLPPAKPRAARVVSATLIDASIVLAVNAAMVNMQEDDRFREGAILLAIVFSPAINVFLATVGGLTTPAVRRIANGASVQAYRAFAVGLPLVFIPLQFFAFAFDDQWRVLKGWLVRNLAQ
jgi:hypothetical protein